MSENGIMCVRLKKSDLQQSAAVLHSICRASLLFSVGDLVSNGIGGHRARVKLCGLIASGIRLSLRSDSFPLQGRIRVGLLVLRQVVAARETLVAQ